ncbi:MAG: hypothetical protein JWO33_328 [Caulobacteraceae bacterium]|nr:hypothetical protein [Caulobacteraceae bacterium]
MLRAVLIAITVVLLTCAVVLAVINGSLPGVWGGVIWAVALLVGLVFERSRYKRILDAPPGPEWTVTAERFVDPETGVATVVYFNPKTGKRAYVKA